MAHSPALAQVRRLFALAAWSRLKGLPPAEASAAFHDAAISRRALLKGAMAGVGVASLPFVQACAGDGRPPGEVRVGIVGAGIAGLHCAHRLVEAGFLVQVYEAQDRVGGRMWTGRDLFPEGQIFEIGGELIDSNHASLWALADEFDIALDDRWALEKPDMHRDTFYFDGERVTEATLLAQAQQVIDTMAQQVADAEEDDDAFEALDVTTLSDWLDEHVPVATMPELHGVLKVAYTGEYGLEADEQSCLNLLYLFGWDSEDEFLIFGASDERYHTHLGNDTFTTALADAIGSERITTGAALVKAAGPRRGPFTLTFDRGGDTTTTEVDHLVFALPFTKLRQVDLTDLALSDEKREVIAELAYGTNAKIMGGFSSRPWWDDLNESGNLTTDLGVQQGWDSTIGQSGDGGIWTNFTGGDVGVASATGTADAWFSEILEDLEVIWPGAKDAYTGTAHRMHWPSFEWSLGSYTCYRPGQWAYWSTEGTREGYVHFCGEHCSLDFQGWMEGAAETGALVAAEIADDHAAQRSAGHEVVLRTKLLVPQASYHGDRHGKLRWANRRRRLFPPGPLAY